MMFYARDVKTLLRELFIHFVFDNAFISIFVRSVSKFKILAVLHVLLVT